MKSLLVIAYTHYSSDARVQRQAEAAHRAGFAVDVIVLKRDNKSRDEVLNWIHLRRIRARYYRGSAVLPHLFSYFNFIFRVFLVVSWRHLKKKYRIIHVNNMPDFLVFSTIAAKLLGAKVILDIHDPMPELYKVKFAESGHVFWPWAVSFQQKASARYSDRVITVSEPVKSDVLAKDGIHAGKISVVANFADEEVFTPVEHFRVSSPLRMIFHGTIAERFGFGSILAALAGVSRKEKLFLKILGEGDYENTLRELIAAARLDEFVEFENRTYPLSRLPMILKEFHLGLVPYEVSPATDYMLPVKMLELLAMGIPSITISNPAVRYYVDESMYFPYNPADLNSLTGLFNRLIDEPALILEKRESILKNREKFLWKAERGKYLRILDQLAK